MKPTFRSLLPLVIFHTAGVNLPDRTRRTDK